MDNLITAGIGLNLALQSIGGLTGLMKAFSFLGTQEFFLIIMPALYWCWDAGLGLRLAVVLIASNGLNSVLKLAFTAPRPYWVDARVQALSTETSYGFPSGHAMNATAIWGFLAAQLRHGWGWAVALVLIGGISLSRLYLGVHFPLDVLGGWLLGAALVWAMLRWEARAVAGLRRLGPGAQWGVALAVSLGYLAVGAAVLAAVGGVVDPPEWARTAALAGTPIAPRDPEGLINTSGMLFGLGAALILAQHGPAFNAGGSWLQRGLRFLVGLAGVLLVWRGLGAIFPAEPFLLGAVLRWVRYALIVFWALDLAPRMFRRLRLA